MTTVSRYLLVQFLTASAGVFVGLLVTWVAADMLLHLDQFGGDVKEGLRGVLLRSLDIVALGLPMACLAGVVWSLTRAVRHREITAIRCGGIPLRVALIPLLVAAAGIAAVSGVLEDRVLMPARQVLSMDESDAPGEGPARPTRMLDRWWYSDGSSILSAQQYDPATRKLSGVSVFQFDDQRRIERRIEARSATNKEGSNWNFRFATIREFDRDGGLKRSKERSLEIDLGVTGQDMERVAPVASTTTLHKLSRAIRDHQGDETELASLQTLFHSRLAQPLAVLILVLLAIPFAIGDVERGDSLPRALLMSIACAAGYWLFWTAGVLAGRTGMVPAFLPVWGVTIAALAVGAYRYRQIQE